MAETTTKEIIEAFVKALQVKLDLTPQQVYPAIVGDYVPGQGQRVINVVPGDIVPIESPEGGQIGGFLFRQLRVTLVIWWRVKYDQHRHSEQVILRDAEGFLDFTNTVREVFDLTTFTGLLTERVAYVGESPTVWHDYDAGVVRRDITFTAKWACRLPFSATVTAADLED